MGSKGAIRMNKLFPTNSYVFAQLKEGKVPIDHTATGILAF